jgi:hypothetical protein
MMGQKQVPSEWLAGENLKSAFFLPRIFSLLRRRIPSTTVRAVVLYHQTPSNASSAHSDLEVLSLGSPLSKSTSSNPPILPFSLIFLKPWDHYPGRKRDWTSTFTLLSASPTKDSLTSLDLINFPSAPDHIIDLIPFAPTLTGLQLPTLVLADSLWRIFPFLTALSSSFSTLVFESLSGSLSELLLAFPPTLTRLHIGVVDGSVPKTWTTFIAALEKLDGVKRAEIGRAVRLQYEEMQMLQKVVEGRDVSVAVMSWDHTMSGEEVRRLSPFALLD